MHNLLVAAILIPMWLFVTWAIPTWIKKREDRMERAETIAYVLSRCFQLGPARQWDPLWGNVNAREYWAGLQELLDRYSKLN